VSKSSYDSAASVAAALARAIERCKAHMFSSPRLTLEACRAARVGSHELEMVEDVAALFEGLENYLDALEDTDQLGISLGKSGDRLMEFRRVALFTAFEAHLRRCNSWTSRPDIDTRPSLWHLRKLAAAIAAGVSAPYDEQVVVRDVCMVRVLFERLGELKQPARRVLA
jgi:hypothetical protein